VRYLKLNRTFLKRIISLAATTAFFILSVFPVPVFAFNVNVVQGNATVSSNGNTVTITAAGKAILQGNTSIPAGVTVDVIQGINDILLRDTTGSRTDILGSLLSNGNIILINTMGVYFGKSANVNVGGLIASSLDIQNQLFMSGTYQFEKISGLNPAEILNEANINIANGGYLILLADRVVNKGTITAYMGIVAFGSGQQATVSFDQGGLVNLVIDKGLAQQLTNGSGKSKAQILNSGGIYANGGKIQMTAELFETTLEKIVNNTGIIEANNVVAHGGVVDLTASGAINNTGTIQAGIMTEQGETFRSTGVLDIGHGNFNNLDGAINISGDISGTYSDVDNIDLTGAVTLTGDTTLQADSGATGTQGEIVMNGNSLTGGGFNLTLTAGVNDTLDGSITGVNLLTLNSSTPNNVTFTSTGASFSVNTIQTNYDTLFSRLQGAGTSSNPYMIYSDSDVLGGLQYIPTESLSAYYQLANNINAGETSSWNAGAGFIPVGNNSTPYSGTFNGNNYTISNLFINLPTTDNVGLFGYTSGAVIENIGLLNVNITGQNNTGSLVGNNEAGSIVDSYANGSVSGSGNQVGGFVGYDNSSSIADSYANSIVSGSTSVGGLVGAVDISSIVNSYATGSVSGVDDVGGLVGTNSSSDSITNSYATGNVSGSGSQIGGLVGESDNNSNISNSYATGSVSGSSNAGGLVGLNSSSTITNSYYTDSNHQNGLGTFESDGPGSFFNISNPVYTGSTPWDFTNTWLATGIMYPLLLISFDIWSGSGNWSNAANWSMHAVPTSGSNVLFDATNLNNSTIDAFGGGIGNLVITSDYTGSITQDNALTLSGNYVQSGGTFNQNAGLSMGGSFMNTGGIFNAGSQPVTFTGLGSISSGGISFNNLTIDASGAYTLADALTVNGNLDIASGTLIASSGDLDVSGDWINSGGTFNANGGDVVLTGTNQQISGNNTFFDLTKIDGGLDALTFTDGDTQTVTGQLDLAGGDAAHQLSLRSTSSPSTWLLNLEGTVDLSYLNVKDSQASGTLASCTVNCTDSGNNAGWFFGSLSLPPSSSILGGAIPQQQEVTRQGFNVATVSIEDQAGGGNGQGISAYWIPYGENWKNIQNDSRLNIWEADHAVQEPRDVELLPSSDSQI
jgi:filamentous hemagglutinin family protein